jgi:amino acid transporter
VVGTVIGSGVFKKANVVAAGVPFSGAAALVWVLCGALVLLGALAYAEVSTLYPRAGGNYVFLREGYGRLWGFMWGWVEFWIIRTASIAALATIFTESLNDVLSSDAVRSAFGQGPGRTLGYWPQRIVTVSVILILTLVNVRGVKWGGVLQVLVTTVKVASLLAIIALPLAALALALPPPAQPQLQRLEPVWPGGLDQLTFKGLSGAFLGVLWAYHGWMNIGLAAGEVKAPQRNIPLSLLLGVLILIGLYLGANLAYYLILSQPEMARLAEPGSMSVAAAFGQRLLGPLGLVLASAAIMISVFGALNGNLLVGPRLLYAMGADGLAPRALNRVHPGYRTPALAIVTTAAWSCLLVLGAAGLTEVGALSRDVDHFDLLTDLAMFGAVIFETMAVLSIFMFRRKRPDAERPYRCWGYPWVPALYVVLPAFILFMTFLSKAMLSLSATAFIGLGVGVYFALGLYRTPPDTAGASEEENQADVAPDGAFREGKSEGIRPDERGIRGG